MSRQPAQPMVSDNSGVAFTMSAEQAEKQPYHLISGMTSKGVTASVVGHILR
jgi:hypothetical protein